MKKFKMTRTIIFSFLFFVVRTTGNKLPEPLIPYDKHNSVCYGPGSHGQLRPSCPNTDSVIALQSIKVGAKPLSKNCPSSVTEWTNHTGSYLVDHSNISVILDETTCCLPNEADDCIFEYNYTNSGLDHYYHRSSSGYTQSKPNMEVSWQTTNCKNASLYPAGTNYMVMDYSCIERSRIGDMCSNKTYNVTSSAFYLTNSDYPKSVVSTISSCECQIQTNGSNIDVYSVDIRPEMHGKVCKQGVNITDSNEVTTWDCEAAPMFNITQLTKGHLITVNLTNDLKEDGGHFFMGISGVGSEHLTVSCSYEMKHGTTKPTSAATLNTLQPTESVSVKLTASTRPNGSISVNDTSILQPSETTTRHTETFQTSESMSRAQSSIFYTVNSVLSLTLQTSEETWASQSAVLQSGESTPALHTMFQSSRHFSTSITSTLQFSERKSELFTTTLLTIDKTLSIYTSNFQNDESTMTPKLFTSQSSEITPEIQHLTSHNSTTVYDPALSSTQMQGMLSPISVITLITDGSMLYFQTTTQVSSTSKTFTSNVEKSSTSRSPTGLFINHQSVKIEAPNFAIPLAIFGAIAFIIIITVVLFGCYISRSRSRRTGVEEGNIEMPELNNHDNRRNENDNSNNDPIEQIPGEENDDYVNSESEEMDTDENETNDIVLEVPIHYRNEISRRPSVEEGIIESAEINNIDRGQSVNDNSNNDPIEQIPREDNDDNANISDNSSPRSEASSVFTKESDQSFPSGYVSVNSINENRIQDLILQHRKPKNSERKIKNHRKANDKINKLLEKPSKRSPTTKIVKKKGVANKIMKKKSRNTLKRLQSHINFQRNKIGYVIIKEN